MDSYFLEITKLVLDNVQNLMWIILVVTVVVSSSFRDSIMKVIRLFLYRDNSTVVFEKTDHDISNIESRIKSIEKNITNNLLNEKSDAIHNIVKSFVDSNIQSLIKEKISDPNTIKIPVLENIKADIGKEVSSYLSKLSQEDISKSIYSEKELQNSINADTSLQETLSRESNSASMLKMVMINLFVFSTITFLIFNIVEKPNFTGHAYLAIVGLYFSLGAFMLYIIRTSHFRSSALLAIKEDTKNYYNMLSYITKKNGNDLTEHDVDVIRMIMTNRAEREHKADHPYEVILKGVSGSNVQFKGGKISLGKGMKE